MLEKEKEVQENFKKIMQNSKRRTLKKPAIYNVSGYLTESILKAQIQQEADLIVMGTMGDTNGDESVTHTSNLILHANCPVLTVPYGCPITLPKEIALLLGKEEIEKPRMLNTLLAIARNVDAKVHALTIFKESIYKEKAIVASTENTVEYYLEHFYSEHNFSKNQDIEEGILEFINEKAINLLAILPKNKDLKDSLSDGKLTKLMALHSTIPVLTLA